MTVTYCYSWNDMLQIPRDLYDNDTARARHQSGQLYTALLGEPEAPHTVVVVRLEVPSIGIYFLDDELRRQMIYDFGWPEEGQLFLHEGQRFEFADDGSKKSSELTTFQKDGLLNVTVVDFVARTTREYNLTADVSNNWEPIPTFGDYASIARSQRGAVS